MQKSGLADRLIDKQWYLPSSRDVVTFYTAAGVMWEGLRTAARRSYLCKADMCMVRLFPLHTGVR